MKTRRFFIPLTMTLIGIMTALGTVIYMFLPEIPLVPGVEYMKLDLSNVPAIVVGTAVHPLAGVLVVVFQNLIHLLKTTTLGIGELMNIGMGATVILSLSGMTAVFARLFKKDRFHPVPYFSASAVTVACAVPAGWLLNWALTPLFYQVMGFPLTDELLWAGVFGSTLLNTVKTALSILPFYPLYRAVASIAKKTVQKNS